MINLLHGDCLEQMKTLDDNSVDAIVSDPPYGISFMSKKWDYDVPSVEVWEEAMRVLKPGGHALIACGTRTQHRMVVNIEDAGFEIRDVVSWIYGSGFPKSLNISKAIDKAAGAEREVVGTETRYNEPSGIVSAGRDERTLIERKITAPATEAAKQWDGWGTALKPSCEFFTLCRKPLSEKTVAANVLKWGTGGINIDGCRVGTEEMQGYGNSPFSHTKPGVVGLKKDKRNVGNHTGRFPANLIHDGSQEVLELFPDSGDKSPARFFKSCEFDTLDLLFCRAKSILNVWKIRNVSSAEPSSSQQRKLECSVLSDAVIVASQGDKLLSDVKGLSTNATEKELETICETLITAILSLENGVSLALLQEKPILNGSRVSVVETQKQTGITTITISLPKSDGYAEPVTFSIMQTSMVHGAKDSRARAFYCAKASKKDRNEGCEELEKGNNHATVKPTALMAYLCKLITPPGGVVLDPYMGSGSTGKAAVREGFGFVGCELDPDYYEIAKARIYGA